MSTTITPNMGLVVPTVASEPGPDWANEINGDMSAIDSHNHGPGQGVAIEPSGLNISTDLTFAGNSATTLKTARFDIQSAPLASSAPNVSCLYVSGNELYYNDSTGGNQVQITNNGSVNAGAGSISGLPSGTASASYAAGTFTWQSATATAAAMDAGSVVIRRMVASGQGVTLQAPSGLSGAYSLTLPTSTPVSANSFVISDTSGNLAYAAVDGTSLQLTSSTVSVKDSGITTAKIADLNVTRPKLVAVGQQISSSSGLATVTGTSIVDVTNLSVTITTTGRPVIIFIQPENASGNPAGIYANYVGGPSESCTMYLQKGFATEVARWQFVQSGTSNFQQINMPYFLDTPAAGTIVYKISAANSSLTASMNFNYVVLVAYEL